MSDSSVYCNLCYRVIEKRNERVLLSKGWKQFDVVTEIESLEISLRSTENKYVCRNCVVKLKKHGSLIEQAELKSLSTSEDSLALKRTGELLSDDHDAPTSKKACAGSDKGFPCMLTSSPVRPLQSNLSGRFHL